MIYTLRESQHPESKIVRVRILRDGDTPGVKRCVNVDTGKELNIAQDQFSFATYENPIQEAASPGGSANAS